MSRITERKYQALLLVLATVVLLFPALQTNGTSRFALDLLLSVTFISSFLAIFTNHRYRIPALILGIPTAVGVWASYALPGDSGLPMRILFHILGASFFGFTVYVILHNIHTSTVISTDSIYGAFCGYLMIGLLFGHLFTVTALVTDDAFRGNGFAPQSPDDLHFLLTYYSFLTLTTVGYGDIVPHAGEARGLAIIEAIMGQFYIAVLVAELIGKRGRQPMPHHDMPQEQQSS